MWKIQIKRRQRISFQILIGSFNFLKNSIMQKILDYTLQKIVNNFKLLETNLTWNYLVKLLLIRLINSLQIYSLLFSLKSIKSKTLSNYLKNMYSISLNNLLFLKHCILTNLMKIILKINMFQIEIFLPPIFQVFDKYEIKINKASLKLKNLLSSLSRRKINF